MNPDVRGKWYGNEFSDGLTYAHANGLSPEGWGGPPERYKTTLVIETQTEYNKYPYGNLISTVSGYLSQVQDGYNVGVRAISGFVHQSGLVKLSFFTSGLVSTCAFNGNLTITPNFREISGEWTNISWDQGIFLHSSGVLKVRQIRSLAYGPFRPWM
jgi:hypothetical protein